MPLGGDDMPQRGGATPIQQLCDYLTYKLHAAYQTESTVSTPVSVRAKSIIKDNDTVLPVIFLEAKFDKNFSLLPVGVENFLNVESPRIFGKFRHGDKDVHRVGFRADTFYDKGEQSIVDMYVVGNPAAAVQLAQKNDKEAFEAAMAVANEHQR
jgi:hypothetical protein